MPNRILLRTVCPACHRSLMDPDHPLDGVPSIHVNAADGENSGAMRMSSIYGRYGLQTDLTLEPGRELTLRCPHCAADLTGPFDCDHCGGRLSHFGLKSGGFVNICNRVGCHRHFLELDDIAADGDNLIGRLVSPIRSGDDLRHEPLSGPGILESGSFLAAFCPHCEVSLIDAQGITFLITDSDGREGRLTLSPYLNVYTHQSTIALPDGTEAADISCPHCRHTLVCEEIRCGECGGRTAHITVSAMRKLIAFHVCMVAGCRWHGLSERDTQLIRLEDSLEW